MPWTCRVEIPIPRKARPLFAMDHTRMLFGDARRSVEALVAEVRKEPVG